MTDITDQLRQAAANMNEQGLVGWGKLLNHTIELIERLAQKLRVEGNCNGQLERQIAERDAEIERLRSDNATLRTAFAVAEDQSAHSVSLVEGLEADRDALRDQLEQSHAGRGDEGPGMIATTADLGPPVPEYTITITVKEYIRLRMTAEKSVQRKIALRQLNAAHGVACLTMRLMAHQLNDASARLRGEKP